MYKLLLILLYSILFISCNNTGGNKAHGTYIGGVIENPRGDYIVLFHNDQVIDSIKLDDKNSFTYRNDSLNEGLYIFKHREYQRFYLTAKDSLLIHVNTIDFDESLKYSGVGAEKNNLLMTIFLEDEKAQKKLPEWFLLSPNEYLQKLDSVDIAHQKFHNKYAAKERNVSKEFNQTIRSNLTYDIFLWKEMYVSANLMAGNAAIQEDLPKTFLKHRKEIDYGNELMRSHYSYYRFMDNYYNNVAFNTYKEVDSFDRGNFMHAQAKLMAVNKFAHHETLRNRLLRRTAMDYLLHSTDVKKATVLFNRFKKFSSNEANITQMEHILEQTVKIVPGNQIPNVQLVGLDNKTMSLHAIIKKPTVIYFWTYESANHYREVHEKAEDLRLKYPGYDFIAINADDHFRKWRRIAETISTDKDTEYQLDNLPSAKSVLMLDVPERTIIVDSNGNIKNANTAITDMAFEDVL